ncbi:unnamed protein product [Peniophora sp. CBMAI 1063]|nr:unnamed protein product [Peniophora sp. CBMAI 1063]
MTLVICGVCISEYMGSFWFDYNIATELDSRPPLTKSVKWMYMFCRYSNLMLCAAMVLLDTYHRTPHCLLLMSVINVAGSCAVASGNFLLLIRVGVLWRWDKRIITFFALMFLGSAITMLRAFVLVKSHPENELLGPVCELAQLRFDLPNFYMFLCLDFSLLVFLFLGLYRWSRGGTFEVWKVLWNQGLVYLAAVIILEIPMTFFLTRNYNEYMNNFFAALDGIVLPLVTTRFYRSLTTFANGHHTHETTYYWTEMPQWAVRVPDVVTMRTTFNGEDNLEEQGHTNEVL